MALSHLPFPSDPDSEIDSLEPLPSSDEESEELLDPHCSCSLLSMAEDLHVCKAAAAAAAAAPPSSSSAAANDARRSPSRTKRKPRRRGIHLTRNSNPRKPGRKLADERAILHRLCRQLHALKSMLPPSKVHVHPSSIIADALEYKKTLQHEIQLLLLAMPMPYQAHQVNVTRRSTGCLYIKVECEKKNGLLIALMEAMEGSGLVFDRVNVSCSDCICIDAVASQKSSEGAEVHALRMALLRIIIRFQSLF